MDRNTQARIEEQQIAGTSVEGKELLTAEDLLHLQLEDDPFMLNELNLCTVCSWTSSTN